MTATRLPIRRLPDGRAALNLGCSDRIAAGWNNVDFSWLLRLGRHPLLCALLHRTGMLSDQRYKRVRKLDAEMVVWDLRKGIPYADGAFDVVYHSHLLEHIDREDASVFLRECGRVLAPSGILRIVVPDLERLARRYIHALDEIDAAGMRGVRTQALYDMIDQMIVRTPTYRRNQPMLVRLLEHVFIGDTARAGILHRWMYDRISLQELLESSGFAQVRIQAHSSSQVAGWNEFLLDVEVDGNSYKADSLYVEATRA